MATNNGNGNHNGNGELKDSVVLGNTSQGAEIHATLVRLTRYSAVFEIYNPALVLRASEVLDNFKIAVRERIIYSGRAVVRTLLNAGLTVICEVNLNEGGWRDVAFSPEMLANGKLREEFRQFLDEWQRLYKIGPEYKLIISDMQSFLANMRLWLEQVELGIRSVPSGDRLMLEQDITKELAEPIIPCVDALFERFEAVAKTIEEDLVPAHYSFMRRQLHPFVLSAPFAYRTYMKPLGYAGDYEMVNMMARNTPEGGSLFARVVNAWFLRQPPAQAHRNRINYLIQMLTQETARALRMGRSARIMNVGCGPAQEVQRFLSESPLGRKTSFTLLDFNEETIQYTRSQLENVKRQHSPETNIEYTKKSVHHILKESGKAVVSSREKQYDCVYCAGLFDYLSDQVCHRLLNIMYEWLAPGGLLVVTNVEPSNPLRNGMGHLLDWHLIYRTGPHLRKLAPDKAHPDDCRIQADVTGVNVFLEVRKPANA
jgi:extracellular factor (EF) 3-hydroxypalmitic acid methyl ester biosynthesis protein